MAGSFKELIVCQKAMDLVEETYRIVKYLPREELYALSDQMRRVAISIPSNIAEGQVRNSTKEFVNFLSIARGSNAELQTQFLVCRKLGYLTKDDAEKAMGLSQEVGKMLLTIIQKLTTDH